MNIVLIGMSGSGKSTFGAYCSNLLNMPFIDLDVEICKNFGGSIPLIFSTGGERLFRELENFEAQKAAAQDNAVIATGGGTVLSDSAMRALKKSGLVVYLDCDVQTLASRLSGSLEKRPLLNGETTILEKLEKMLGERAELYEKYSDVTLYESKILSSRNILQEDLNVQLGAMYLELVLKLEKKVYAKIK